MTAALAITPTTPAPSSTVTVSATGGGDHKNRLLLDGTVAAAHCYATDFTESVDLSAAASQALTWEQLILGTWTLVASLTITTGTFPTGAALTYTARPAIPSLPTYLTPFTDPTWNTTGVRVSNVASRRHFYARYQAWNCDATKILLNFGFPGRMIDGTTYADIGSFSTLSNAVWTNTDPNKLYGVDGGGDTKLYTQNATTGALTTKHTFAGYHVWIGGDSSSWEGGISDDDRYICLTLEDVGAGGGNRLVVYDTVGDTLVGNIAKPSGMDNAQISRLGNYVVVVASGGTRAYSRDLTTSRLLTTTTNHGDNALDETGREIYVTNNAPGVVAYILAGGSRNLLPAGSAFEYGHTAGHALHRNGWIYLSVYDTVTTAGRLGWDQVVALATDGSGDVQVFGFANHNTNGGTYATQPHASPSPDGQRVIFASEWGATNVYAYVYSL